MRKRGWVVAGVIVQRDDRPDTPEEVLNAYVDALNRGDVATAMSYTRQGSTEGVLVNGSFPRVREIDPPPETQVPVYGPRRFAVEGFSDIEVEFTQDGDTWTMREAPFAAEYSLKGAPRELEGVLALSAGRLETQDGQPVPQQGLYIGAPRSDTMMLNLHLDGARGLPAQDVPVRFATAARGGVWSATPSDLKLGDMGEYVATLVKDRTRVLSSYYAHPYGVVQQTVRLSTVSGCRVDGYAPKRDGGGGLESKLTCDYTVAQAVDTRGMPVLADTGAAYQVPAAEKPERSCTVHRPQPVTAQALSGTVSFALTSEGLALLPPAPEEHADRLGPSAKEPEECARSQEDVEAQVRGIVAASETDGGLVIPWDEVGPDTVASDAPAYPGEDDEDAFRLVQDYASALRDGDFGRAAGMIDDSSVESGDIVALGEPEIPVPDRAPQDDRGDGAFRAGSHGLRVVRGSHGLRLSGTPLLDRYDIGAAVERELGVLRTFTQVKIVGPGGHDIPAAGYLLASGTPGDEVDVTVEVSAGRGIPAQTIPATLLLSKGHIAGFRTDVTALDLGPLGKSLKELVERDVRVSNPYLAPGGPRPAQQVPLKVQGDCRLLPRPIAQSPADRGEAVLLACPYVAAGQDTTGAAVRLNTGKATPMPAGGDRCVAPAVQDAPAGALRGNVLLELQSDTVALVDAVPAPHNTYGRRPDTAPGGMPGGPPPPPSCRHEAFFTEPQKAIGPGPRAVPGSRLAPGNAVPVAELAKES